MKASSIIPDIIIDNKSQSVTFFPKELEIFKLLKVFKNISEIDMSKKGPENGSFLFRFSHLNSGSTFISNAIYKDSQEYRSNCLSSCALNFAFNPSLSSLPTKKQQKTNDPKDSSVVYDYPYKSLFCLSCNSIYPFFTQPISKNSLKTNFFDPNLSIHDKSQNSMFI